MNELSMHVLGPNEIKMKVRQPQPSHTQWPPLLFTCLPQLPAQHVAGPQSHPRPIPTFAASIAVLFPWQWRGKGEKEGLRHIRIPCNLGQGPIKTSQVGGRPGHPTRVHRRHVRRAHGKRAPVLRPGSRCRRRLHPVCSDQRLCKIEP